MVKTCCACEYKFQKGVNIKLHVLPNIANVRERWTAALEQKNIIPSDKSLICSLHFTKDDYTVNKKSGRVRLKNTACPTIFKKFSDSDSEKKIRSIVPKKLDVKEDTKETDSGAKKSSSSCKNILKQIDNKKRTLRIIAPKVSTIETLNQFNLTESASVPLKLSEPVTKIESRKVANEANSEAKKSSPCLPTINNEIDNIEKNLRIITPKLSTIEPLNQSELNENAKPKLNLNLLKPVTKIYVLNAISPQKDANNADGGPQNCFPSEKKDDMDETTVNNPIVLKSRKRKFRYVGDYKYEQLESPQERMKLFDLIKKTRIKHRRERNTYHQKVSRLQRKVSQLTELVKHLKNINKIQGLAKAKLEKQILRASLEKKIRTKNK